MMHSWQAHGLGEPEDVLTWGESSLPSLGADELRLKVDAVSLNFPDLLLCRGEYQERPNLPFTPGLEICGTVLDGPRAGERLLAAPALPHGGLAEEVHVPAASTLPVPDDMPATVAATLLITYQTAYVALHRRASLRPGETLLVHAGAGGVGSAAIQLGKAAGATVIATAGGPDKVRLCHQLGADVVVDYLVDDFVPTVKEITSGRGADVVFDPVGGDTFDASRRVTAFEGRLVVVGFAGGRIADVPTNHVLVKNYSVVGIHWGLYRNLAPSVVTHTHEQLVELWRQGVVAPLINERVEMSEAPAAITRLGNRGTTGKVVVLGTH